MKRRVRLTEMESSGMEEKYNKVARIFEKLSSESLGPNDNWSIPAMQLHRAKRGNEDAKTSICLIVAAGVGLSTDEVRMIFDRLYGGMSENKQHNTRYNMKRTIRLTERDLHRVIKESVRRVLREGDSHAWALTDDGVDEFDLESGYPTLDTNGRYIEKGTADYMGPKIELARQLGSGTGSGYEFRQRHYRNKFAEDDPIFRDARSFVDHGKFYNPYGYEDAEQDMKDFNDAERRRQRAADRRWQKAADSRPLHRKGSLNRE